VSMAFITIIGIRTAMFCWISCACWYSVTTLANTGVICVFILSLASCVAEIDLAGAGGRRISLNQVDVFQILRIQCCRVCRIIINMGTVTISTLNVLTLGIMALFTGMTVGTDIQVIRLATGDWGTFLVCTQEVAITGAQISIVVSAFGTGCAVKGRTA